MMKNRYLLFGYDRYYPEGGINDLQGSYRTIKQAIEIGENIKSKWDYCYIVDKKTMSKVYILKHVTIYE